MLCFWVQMRDSCDPGGGIGWLGASIFSCPADHVPDWYLCILLDLIEARSVNVKNTHTHSRRNLVRAAEILETMLYGCVTWSPRACHYNTLRRAHHSFFIRCTGWRKHNRADPPIFYLDILIKTGNENIEPTLRRRRILFAGFVARMEDTRLPKCVMFGEMVGGAGCVGGQEKEWMGCFLDDLRAFGINAYQ